MADITLPPAASATTDQQWQQALSMPIPMTAAMLQARFNPTIQFIPTSFLQRVETPNPSHQMYSRIEAIKKENEDKQGQMNRAIMRSRRLTMEASVRPGGWAPPEFTGILKAKLPTMKMMAQGKSLYSIPRGRF